MTKEFDDLYDFCVALFGKEKIEREDYTDPDGIDIVIDARSPNSPVKQIELTVYRGDQPQSFMLPDDFRFEYNEDERRAISEMKYYLQAIKEGRAYVSAWRFLGLKFNEKLLVK
jgi:hypothetical protein